MKIDPKLKEWATPLQAKKIDLINELGTARATAKALGVHLSAVTTAVISVRKKAAAAGYMPDPTEAECAAALNAWAFCGKDATAAADRLELPPGEFSRLLRIAQERQRQAAVEPNATPGFVVRGITRQFDADGELRAEAIREGPAPSQAPGGEDAGPARDGGDGYIIKGVSTLFDGAGNVRGQWVKTKIDHEQYVERLRAAAEEISREVVPVAPLAAPARCDDDLLTVYPIGDPHAGMYASIDETGTHFDLPEFERIQKAAIDRLVLSTPSSAIAIFNDKGDSTHADNSKNRTPKSGHELDVHGRHTDVVRVAIRVKRYQIARLLEKHAKVIVRIDPGNHDVETALHLALILEAYYENEPRVEVVTSPNPYWYYLFGRNLIGTCHGDGAKGKDLPGIMAHDVREWWGKAENCVWFVGHVHHKDIKDYTGCTVEYQRTLAPTDAHAHKSGYRSKRSIEAITYHRLDGEEDRHTCSLARIERLLEAA